MIQDPPAISVVISTRNRACVIERAVSSILAIDDPRFELVLVDQSDTCETEEALKPFAGDSRLRLIASSRVGVARGRNLGCRETFAELIAFTDDDCEVSPDWLQNVLAAFGHDPRIGVVFGSIAAPAYNHSTGFIVAYRAPAFHIERGLRNKARVEGMGACMAMRRAVWEQLGGFDEALGAGGPFHGGEDTDLTVRALLAGWSVAETPDAIVTHHGIQEWSQCRRIVRGYMFALGAVYAKVLRLGKAAALQLMAHLAWRWLAKRPAADLNHTPPRGLRLWAFLQGLRAGLRTPLLHGHFGPVATAEVALRQLEFKSGQRKDQALRPESKPPVGSRS